jgi:hypothetical protein
VSVRHVGADNWKERLNVWREGTSHVLGNLFHESERTRLLN